MATSRVVKALAGMEDLLTGVGTEEQARGESTYEIGKIDIPYSVESIEAMSALDVNLFTKARVYFSAYTAVDYVYDPAATSGEESTGSGYWIKDTTLGDMIDTYLGEKYESAN